MQLNSGVPAELQRIIEKAMEKDRDLRCQSAAEIRSDLKRLKRDTSSGRVKTASHAESAAASSSSVNVVPATVGRTKRVVAGVAIAVLGLAAFAGYKWLTRPHEFSPQSMRITKLTDSGKVGNVAISPDGRYIVYVMVDGEQQGLWIRNVTSKSDVQVLSPDIVQFYGVTFSLDGNYLYFTRSDKNTIILNYLYMMPVLGGIPRQLIQDVDSPVSFSPDGKQFAYMRNGHGLEIRIANLDGSSDHLLATLPAGLSTGANTGPIWSPDGETIMVSSMQMGKEVKYTLTAINVADGGIRELLSGPEWLGLPAWLPDGSSILIPMEQVRENRRQLWFISFPSGEKRRFSNDLSSYGPVVGVTQDGRMLVTLESKWSSHVWILPQGRTAQAKQITFGETPDGDVAPGPGGKLLVRSGYSELALMNADGSQRTLLRPGILNYNSMSTCDDRYLVFDVTEENKVRLYRTDVDGSNPVKLSEEVNYSQCSPDGTWVLYDSRGTKYRLPIEGGAPTEIASSYFFSGAISPDGQWVAYEYGEGSPVPLQKIAVIPAAGGWSPTHVLLRPMGASGLCWSPNQKGVQYLLMRNGADNVWEQPLAGGAPHQITNFTSGRIFSFSWTRDGKQLLLAKGELKRDVVLISNFQ